MPGKSVCVSVPPFPRNSEMERKETSGQKEPSLNLSKKTYNLYSFTKSGLGAFSQYIEMSVDMSRVPLVGNQNRECWRLEVNKHIANIFT